MFHDLFNLNRWQRKSRCIGLVLLKYCVRLEERIDADKTLSQDQKDKMQLAIDQALAALDLVNNGHEYDRNNPNDPVKQAETALKEFFTRREHIPIPEDEVPKDRLSVATQMIKASIYFGLAS
ncbi:hypothetical protein FRB90_007778 [Tulasnella sp. 427]|nr:hypothetical protein FRB90_007778 [Tulasnella sp. 427]